MAAAADLAGAEALVVVTSSSTSPEGEPAHVGLQELAVVVASALGPRPRHRPGASPYRGGLGQVHQAIIEAWTGL